MSKEASQSALSSPGERDATVATVLSMTLEHRGKVKETRVTKSAPANLAEEADDLWDNVPV